MKFSADNKNWIKTSADKLPRNFNGHSVSVCQYCRVSKVNGKLTKSAVIVNASSNPNHFPFLTELPSNLMVLVNSVINQLLPVKFEGPM